MAGRRFAQTLAWASVAESADARPAESLAAVIGASFARSQFAGSRAGPVTWAVGVALAIARAGSERTMAWV